MIEDYVVYLIGRITIKSVAFLILWWLAVIFVVNRLQLRGIRKMLLSVLAMYMGVVAWITIVGRTPIDAANVSPCEWIPFWSWKVAKAEITEGTALMITGQIVLNIVLFIPIGALIYFIEKGWFQRMILWSAAGSLIVEIMQFILGVGIFEWDDIIHNTLGYVIGYVLGSVFHRFFRSFSRKC